MPSLPGWFFSPPYHIVVRVEVMDELAQLVATMLQVSIQVAMHQPSSIVLYQLFRFKFWHRADVTVLPAAKMTVCMNTTSNSNVTSFQFIEY